MNKRRDGGEAVSGFTSRKRFASGLDLASASIPLSATAVSSGGTVCWMSPELLFGRNSPRTCYSDCYALGMVIYERWSLYRKGGIIGSRLMPGSWVFLTNYGSWCLGVGINRPQLDRLPDNCFAVSKTPLVPGYSLPNILPPVTLVDEELI
ncbi:hypothetical protein BDM02DRAFT_1772421 [Thelephora ganbajun]|uniref:Uncharacterized protein n=1 Tax=Thelephora ganbajun TaxID=370292 RepID=A0ACB6ZJV6_THEGA|nr:hypothetical protein BDM02DRAFT_1772421 [Thelephora ganbajun]